MLISTQALTSPARRASETAMRMTDRTETEEQKVGSIYLRMVAGVHPAGMSEPCEALFETMGYGPLRVFFEAAGGEDLCGNQPVSRVQFLGDDAAVLAPSSGEEPASPRH